VCRHAVRLAGCLAVADLLGRGLHLPWPYWVPLTVAVVLRPEFGTTFSRGLARVVGTFVGLAFATLLVQAPLGGAPAHVALVGVLVLGTRIIGPANFGLSAVTLSSLVVVLLTLAGDPPQATIVARGQDTAIGGALALAAYASWPTWERHRLLATLADLLEAYRRYFQAVLAGYLDPDNASAHALAETRQTARLARTNALSSLGRLGAEPAASRQLLGQAEALLASSHRFVRAVMALEAALYHPGGVLAPPSLHALAADVDATLSILGQRLRDPSTTDLPASLPDLRADERALAHALAAEHGPGEARGVLAAQADRIANSLSSMVHVLAAPDAPREQPDNTQRTPVLMATSDR
jgi:uncharacterized membrane protein YccC